MEQTSLKMIDYIDNIETMLQGYELTAGVSKTRWSNALKRNKFEPSLDLIGIAVFFDNVDSSNFNENEALAYSVIAKFVNEVKYYLTNFIVPDLKIASDNIKPLIDLIESDLKGKLVHKISEIRT